MSFNIVKLTDPIQLTNVVGGLVPKGVYAGGTSYSVGDSVSYNGSSYVCILASTGNLPTDTTYWQVLANKGDTGAAGADGADSTVPGPAGADGADGLTVSVNSVTQVAGDISLTQDNIPDGTTNKAYTAAEQTKLSGIEALADVTDATNVASAGAVMDGDFSSNGIMTRTASGTYANRTLTGTANQITVTNGDGVSGNPTLSLPQDIHTGASPTFARINAPKLANTTSANNSSIDMGNFYTQISRNIADAEPALVVLQTHASSTGDIARFNNSSGNVLKITRAGDIAPATDSARTLGTSSLYWSNTYTDRLYLNSTAYLDGSTAGIINITGALSPITSTAASGANNAMYINTGATGNRASINLRGYNASNSGDFLTIEMRTDTNDAVMYVYDASTTIYNTLLNFNYITGVVAFSQNITIADAKNINIGTATGTKIGTATNQKLGFYNATPVVRPSGTPANATDLATAITLVNDLKAKLVTLGLIA